MGMQREHKVVTWTLRTFLLLNILSAAGFIAYALILQNPPKTALPLGLLVVGILSLLATLLGLIGSYRIACCLTIYLVLGGLITLAELGIVLAMFISYDKVVTSLNDYAAKEAQATEKTYTDADAAALADKVAGGRWAFLVVVVLQAISLLVAAILRCCICRSERQFQEFVETGELPASQNTQIQMMKLQQSISGRQPQAAASYGHSPSTASYSSSKLNKSTTQKMAAKYGEYTSEFNKKGWFSRK